MGRNDEKVMNENGELHLFRKNDDHLAIILALRHNAWLVTQDTYKTHSIDKPKERDTHPEWFETGKLDILTRGTRVEKDGWAHFDFVRMPEYRWGIFLAPAEENRKIGFGQHLGEDVWQDLDRQ